MTSKTTARFWTEFESLPVDVQQLAREKFRLWSTEPFHPSLHFKQLYKDLWSVRVSINHRAMARRRGESIVWFWIGTHNEYDRLIARR